MPLTLGQRLQRRAEALAAKAHTEAIEQAEAAKAHDAAVLGERPQSVGNAVDTFRSAFPGATIVEDWQQVGHDDWVDRLTGNVIHETPPGATRLVRD